MSRIRNLAAALCVAAGAVAAFGFVGSAGATTHPAIKNGGTLTELLTTNWPTLDPAGPTITPNEALLDPAIEPLFFQSPQGVIEPNLALSYKFTGGGTLLTLELRHNVKFQDGTPFNAQAAVWNLQRYQSPSVASECVAYFAVVSSIYATGPYSLAIKLSTPDSGFPYLLSALQCGMMVSPKAVQSEGSAFGTSGAVVGTGPFKWVSGLQGTLATFTRWNGYWGPKAHLSTIKVEEVGSTSAAYDAMETGGANFWPAMDAPDFLSQARGSGKFVVQQVPATGISYVAPVFNKPPFNNPVAREALFYATDQKSIIANLEAGLGKTVEGVFPPNLFAYNKKGIPAYPNYDPTKAQQLVSSIPGGVSFTLACSNVSNIVTLCEALQAMWQAVGMKVSISNYAGPAFIAGVHALTFQAYEITNPALPDPDLVAYRWFYSKSPLSQNGLTDSLADKYILEARDSFRLATRFAAYTALDRVLENRDYVWDDLYTIPIFSIQAKNVGGLIASPYQMYHYEDMYIK